MKATKYFSALLFIFAIAFLSTLESCKKDSDSGSTGAPVTKASLLASGPWITSSAIMKLPTGDLDLFLLMDECEKDDLVEFKSDKKIVEDAGAVKCTPSDPQTEDAGTWEFASNETELVITEGTDITTLKIISLTSSEFIVEFTEFDATLQADVTGRFTYKHK
ncbi:lipocalin family protein [bacterium SCSIO 12643]|nr:lipocalin family protein [bacterium SCSIO 12643]